MVRSLIVGAMGVQGGSGVEARLMLDIAADSLESIARFAESMYTSQLSTSVAFSASFNKPWMESSKLVR